MKNQKITFEAAADILGVSKGYQKQLRTLIYNDKALKDN